MQFNSCHHPGKRPAALVYGSALVRPVAATMLPLMIAMTTIVLQSGTVWTWAVWGVPIALTLATMVTHHRLSRQTAELHLRGEVVALRSVSDVIYDRDLEWDPLFDVRTTRYAVEFSAGWTTHTLSRDDWPEDEALGRALQHALSPDRTAGPVSSPSP